MLRAAASADGWRPAAAAAAALLSTSFDVLLPGSSDLQLSMVLPWAEPPGDQRAPTAVFAGAGAAQVAVAVGNLTAAGWEVRGVSVASTGALTPLWNATLPLGAGIPSAVTVAGELAVVHLDGRLLALHPSNGSLAWNATSPCSLGNPRLVNARCGGEGRRAKGGGR